MKTTSKAGVQSEEQTAADMPPGCPEELCEPRLDLPLMSAGSGFQGRTEQKAGLVTVVTGTVGDGKPKCWASLHEVTQPTFGSVLLAKNKCLSLALVESLSQNKFLS